MKILIVGASGFLGRKLFNDLLADKHDVVGSSRTKRGFLKLDITDHENLKLVLDKVKQAIYEGRLWEYVIKKARAHPKLFEMISRLEIITTSISASTTSMMMVSLSEVVTAVSL